MQNLKWVKHSNRVSFSAVTVYPESRIARQIVLLDFFLVSLDNCFSKFWNILFLSKCRFNHYFLQLLLHRTKTIFARYRSSTSFVGDKLSSECAKAIFGNIFPGDGWASSKPPGFIDPKSWCQDSRCARTNGFLNTPLPCPALWPPLPIIGATYYRAS